MSYLTQLGQREASTYPIVTMGQNNPILYKMTSEILDMASKHTLDSADFIRALWPFRSQVKDTE